MSEFDPFVLARIQADPAEVLREDLEDTLKEYMELDLIVELLQNSLDAIDRQRYINICVAANLDPEAVETVDKWNQAILEALEEDYETYNDTHGPAETAVLYGRLSDDSARRDAWWRNLARHFNANSASLSAASDQMRGKLRVTVRLGTQPWIEVEDNGVGMPGILSCFRHKVSQKRKTDDRPRRFGIRGSHGWGLTAVLGLSNLIEVASCQEGKEPECLSFNNYASFVGGQISQPTTSSLNPEELTDLSSAIIQGAQGTHIRVSLSNPSDTNQLGNTLNHYSHAKFETLLRLYTPIGQVNDYVRHPAYHTVRNGDADVELLTIDANGNQQRSDVQLEFFQLSGRTVPSHYSFKDYIDSGSQRGKSVHTIHRSKFNDKILLSGADIQAAEELHNLEDLLLNDDVLPAHLDETDSTIATIPRGF